MFDKNIKANMSRSKLDNFKFWLISYIFDCFHKFLLNKDEKENKVNKYKKRVAPRYQASLILFLVLGLLTTSTMATFLASSYWGLKFVFSMSISCLGFT